MRNRPRKGSLSSRIRRIALATANAPTGTATTLVALRRESIPNQETTISSSGRDTGLANCSDINNRVCSMIPALTPVVGNRAVCIGVFGLSEAMLAFSNFGPGRYASSSGGFETVPAFQIAL